MIFFYFACRRLIFEVNLVIRRDSFLLDAILTIGLIETKSFYLIHFQVTFISNEKSPQGTDGSQTAHRQHEDYENASR
jgi:hypothetical protein